ncbi:MAG: uroporphyrinogen decarboxylase family protein [Desulfopila sp.]
MNDAERIGALLSGQKPDRVPFFALGGDGLANASQGMPPATPYTDPETAIACYTRTAAEYGWLYTPLLAYAAMGSWEFGGEIKLPGGEFDQAPSVLRHPAGSWEEAMALTLPDVSQAGMVPRQKRFYDIVMAQPSEIKAWRLVCQIEGVLTLASNMAAPAHFFKWMIKRPEVVHHLLTLALEFLTDLAAYLKTLYGTDNILIWGGEPASSNQMISPKMFEAFALPYTLKLHERLVDMGFTTIFKHICGDQNLNLPFWARVPMGSPGLVSIGHEVDIDDAAARFPDDIIVGNLNPAVIQTESAEAVYRASIQIIEQGKRLQNGFIFAPGCSLPPKSPPENLAAIKKALDDVGQY